uniref:Uncharacterized protein n=1 Tax=Anguilla anguilla TaxID=7936 RepID=A0A0E9TRI4_ANGAN
MGTRTSSFQISLRSFHDPKSTMTNCSICSIQNTFT